jgi:hypothetical protein
VLPAVHLAPNPYIQTEAQENREAKRKEWEAALDDMTGELEESCLTIIYKNFPEKIKRLDNMYKTAPEFNIDESKVAQTIEVPPNLTKEQRLALVVPCNPNLVKLMAMLKAELLEMSEMMSALAIWVKLNIPRIEDGNNFGVEVQAEILEVLDAAENSGFTMMDTFTAYHIARAELVQEVLKRPGIQDHQLALKELDEKTYLKTTLLALDVRNSYLVLYNLISRNIERIRSPRGDGHTSSMMHI